MGTSACNAVLQTLQALFLARFTQGRKRSSNAQPTSPSLSARTCPNPWHLLVTPAARTLLRTNSIDDVEDAQTHIDRRRPPADTKFEGLQPHWHHHVPG